MTASALLLSAALAACAAPASPFAMRIVDGGIDRPLSREPGDPVRGAAIARSREAACVLCHRLPALPGETAPVGGDLGPPLAGAGARSDVARLRLRIVDARTIEPGTVMPAYHRIEGLTAVADPWVGRPLLDAQQIEDVVAWLATLR